MVHRMWSVNGSKGLQSASQQGRFTNVISGSVLYYDREAISGTVPSCVSKSLFEHLMSRQKSRSPYIRHGTAISFFVCCWRRATYVAFSPAAFCISPSVFSVQLRRKFPSSLISVTVSYPSPGSHHIDDIFLTSVGCSMVMHIMLYYSTCTLF